MEPFNSDGDLRTREVIFHAYITEEVERLFQIEEIQVRANFKQYQFEGTEPLTTLKKEGQIWRGSFNLRNDKVKEIKYRYYIRDKKLNKDIYEHGLKREGEFRSANPIDDEAVITFYDGNLHFHRADIRYTQGQGSEHASSSAKVDRNIVTGWKAMLPNWMDEVQKELSLVDLIKWVDRTERSDRYCNEVSWKVKDKIAEARKQQIKEDIDQHKMLMKKGGIEPRKLFLSMIGLIYRAEKVLEESKKEVMEKLDKLVKETNKEIKAELSNWRLWLDQQSLTGQMHSTMLQAVKKVLEVFVPNGPYLIPIQHYFGKKNYKITNQTEDVLMKLSLDFKKTDQPFSYQDKWASRLEPYLKEDPLLSYSVMSMMEDEENFREFLKEYCDGKHSGIRLDAVLQRSITFLKDLGVELHQCTFSNKLCHSRDFS